GRFEGDDGELGGGQPAAGARSRVGRALRGRDHDRVGAVDDADLRWRRGRSRLLGSGPALYRRLRLAEPGRQRGSERPIADDANALGEPGALDGKRLDAVAVRWLSGGVVARGRSDDETEHHEIVEDQRGMPEIVGGNGVEDAAPLAQLLDGAQGGHDR